MVNITIDGKPYIVKDGTTLIEAIDQAKIDLPRYCYHPGLSIAGNCRVCQVEVEKMPRSVIACNTRVAEGMVIHTKSQKAKESQQAVLEFILANHPLDCPVCDQAGECKLQDYYMEVGLYDSKMDDAKLKKTKKACPVGPRILLDQERCILCSRCVRFGDEITKTSDFGIFNRGNHSELDVYPGKELDNKYSGNVADICPVGALTDRDFRFKIRVWYLGEQESVCPGCSRGCNIFIHYEKTRPYPLKKERVMRLKPRENQDVNRWWMCDDGRYAYKNIDQDRLTETKGSLKELAALLQKAPPAYWAVLFSPQYTNEDLYLQKKLFLDHLKWKNAGFLVPDSNGYEDDFLIRKDKNPNTAGASKILGLGGAADITALVEKAKRSELEGLFIFGHDLANVYGEKTLKELRQKVKVIVYEGTNSNPTAAAADFVIPSAAYAEKEGTFTNFEGRVQRIRMAIKPLCGTHPTYDTIQELSNLLGYKLPFDRPELIFDALSKEISAFRGLNYKIIGNQGALWKIS